MNRSGTERAPAGLVRLNAGEEDYVVGLIWECIAEREGGTIAGFAVVNPGETTQAIFAASAVGLHRSNDGGRSWSAVGQGPVPPFVEAIVPSPAFEHDRTLLIGARTGIYRSSDGGERWHHLLSARGVRALALSPRYSHDGVILAGTEADGVLRSEESGRSWTGANAGLLDLTVLGLALSPWFDADQVCFAATTSGLYRSRNGGRAWRAVGLGPDDPAVQCIAVSPTFQDDRLVLCGTEEDGLFLSRDAGATWEDTPALAGRSVMALAFAPSFAADRRMAVATEDGVALSSDGGVSWRFGERITGPVLSLVFVPVSDGDRLLAGRADGDVTCSDDGGQTWQPANTGLHARPTIALALSPTFALDRTMFVAGLQDGVAISTDGGESWTDHSVGLASQTVVGLAMRRRSDTTWALHAATDTGAYARDGEAARWCPIQVGATDRDIPSVTVVAAGSDGAAPLLVATPDHEVFVEDGATWRSLGRPFGDQEIISLAVSSAYAMDQTIWAITGAMDPDRADPSLTLWYSDNGGRRWNPWLERRGHHTMALAVSPHYAADGLLFVGLGRQVLTPRPKAQEIWNGAKRPLWRAIEVGNGSPVSVTALATAPRSPGRPTLFAATDRGAYVSRDGGIAFTEWSEGLGSASIVALGLSAREGEGCLIYAVERGGAIWRRTAR